MQHSLVNKHLSLSVKREGAELVSIRTVPDEFEYLWQGDPTYWAGQSFVLFPIIGRVEDSTYTFENRVYRMNMHGFARESEFALVRHDEHRLRYRLVENASTRESYPFRFELLVEYCLDGNRIQVEYVVRNEDVKIMWFSI